MPKNKEVIERAERMIDRYSKEKDYTPETINDLRNLLDGKIEKGIRNQVRVAREMVRRKKESQE